MKKRKNEVLMTPDSRTVDELTEAMMGADPEAPEYMDLRIALSQKPFAEVLDKARTLCSNTTAHVRAVGASLLPDEYHDESFDLLAACLSTEAHPEVLAAISYRLGHMRDAKAINLLLPLRDHPDKEVRFAVVFGLLTYDDPRAIDALISLSEDEDEHVRDWATFGLGSMIETDTPEIRAALIARIDDPHYPTRLEAWCGLARLKDDRIVDQLLLDMENGVTLTTCEALAAIADLVDPAHPLLVPAIERCQRNDLWPNDAEPTDE